MVECELDKFLMLYKAYTVCPGSLDPYYIVIYYINWVRLLGHLVAVKFFCGSNGWANNGLGSREIISLNFTRKSLIYSGSWRNKIMHINFLVLPQESNL